MAMARRGGRRVGGKERLWRRRLRQWRRSGLTVRDFCAAEDVSEPSFYAWRRTIGERDRQAVRSVDAAGALAGKGSGSARPVNGRAPVFVPLRVLPTAAAAEVMFEVVLGRGRVVRVPAGFDAAT